MYKSYNIYDVFNEKNNHKEIVQTKINLQTKKKIYINKKNKKKNIMFELFKK